MKHTKIWHCDYCGNKSENKELIEGCEKGHLPPKGFGIIEWDGPEDVPHRIEVEFGEGIKAFYGFLDYTEAGES